jgi:centromeric protein E
MDDTSAKLMEGKGNVIVSVRVRPDSGGNGEQRSKTEGEWMVDGRRSLVAYKGKEGGDYYYGKYFWGYGGFILISYR